MVKQNILAETIRRYNIVMEYEIDREVQDMCNLGAGIYMRGHNDGFNKGVLLLCIQMIMNKLKKDKTREQIISEMMEDTEIQEKEAQDMYNTVCANLSSTPEEILEIYQSL